MCLSVQICHIWLIRLQLIVATKCFVVLKMKTSLVCICGAYYEAFGIKTTEI